MHTRTYTHTHTHTPPPSPCTQGGSLSKGAVVSCLLEFHSGAVVGLITSPVAHVAMTAGQDGSVRIFDYGKRVLMGSRLFGQPATVRACML